MSIFRIVILGLLAFTLSGCFEIIEDVTVHDDGSGKIKFIFNASQSKSDINALLLLKEVNGYKVPSISKIKYKLESFTDSVKNTPGFSDVKSHFDTDNFIITFEAEFDKVERLNTGIFNLWHRYDPGSAVKETYFSYKNQTFYRSPESLFNLLYRKLKDADRQALTNATYTALYRFDKDVESQKNPSAIISKNKKVVFLKVPIQTLISHSTNWKNTIKLTP